MFSVIMPAYNSEKTIEKSINSVLNQTYQDFEFFIILNGCTDNTENIVNKISKNDQRIKVFSSKIKSRVAARNLGIIKSTRKYIALQDSDDEWFPNKLEVQIKDLENYDVCGSQIQCVNENWKPLEQQEAFRPVSHNEIVSSLLDNWNCLANSSVVFKKDILLRSGLYEENFESYEDYQLWLKMIPYVRFKNSEKTLINYMVKENPGYFDVVPRIINLRNFYRAHYFLMGLIK